MGCSQATLLISHTKTGVRRVIALAPVYIRVAFQARLIVRLLPATLVSRRLLNFAWFVFFNQHLPVRVGHEFG